MTDLDKYKQSFEVAYVKQLDKSNANLHIWTFKKYIAPLVEALEKIEDGYEVNCDYAFGCKDLAKQILEKLFPEGK